MEERSPNSSAGAQDQVQAQTPEQNEKRKRSVGEVFVFLDQKSEIFWKYGVRLGLQRESPRNGERHLHKTFL